MEKTELTPDQIEVMVSRVKEYERLGEAFTIGESIESVRDSSKATLCFGLSSLICELGISVEIGNGTEAHRLGDLGVALIHLSGRLGIDLISSISEAVERAREAHKPEPDAGS